LIFAIYKGKGYNVNERRSSFIQGELMEKGQYAIEELQEIISPIAKKYHISKVFLFGSYA
jgi:hypothetical protein